MNQCVPSWDLDDNSAPSKIKYQPNSPQDVPSLDYEVAELTWENGQLSMHGLGVPRVFNKPTASSSPATWDKPRAGGTLESIVDQATLHHHLPPKPGSGGKELAPWFDHHQHSAMVNPGAAAASASVTVTMDALVPCDKDGGRRHESRDGSSAQVLDSVPAIGASRAAGCSTRVSSCSGAPAPIDGGGGGRRVVRVGVNSCRTNGSVSESATCGGRDSRQTMSIDTWERELGGPGFTSTSPISPENTISGQEYTRASADDRDSVSLHSMSQVSDRKAGEEEGRRRDNGKSSVCTKRSRAAAIHNQSERKRRDKINQRMKTLQKLVPNSSKSDKASMLDEVIEYLKQLQAQVHMMSRMNMPSMMLPLAMQQQMQMSMMGMSMGMGMGMGMGVMDIPRAPAVPPFMPVAAAGGWDNRGDCLPPPPPPASVMPDPLAALLASQSQPMTMEAYSRMAAMYQQLQQQPGSKN